MLQLLCPKLSHVTVTDVSTVYGGLSAIVLWGYVGVFKRHKDASGSIPATKLTQALTDAYARVIPDS